MITAQPRLVVSAPSSGHGKTAIAVGLLAALSGRGIPTAGFKVGPDHTDAAYLGLAAGRPGRNLDPRLVGAQRVAPLFAHGASGAQLSVIEGAMGLFDSLTGQPEVDGTASVAAALRAPVILVVDVAAMGHSLAALVHGFRMFDEMVHLGGVVLNRVASERHEQMLRSAMDDIGMPVLGALHRGDLPNVLPARTHGLVPVAHRTVEAGRAVRRLGEAVSGSLDMDRLMALATSAPPIPGPLWTPAEAAGEGQFDKRPVIALAGGQGAPYTYVETAELLTAAGADVAVVDPLRDEVLPPGTRGLIVGAGLPEGYAEELSANRRLCAAVAQFARDGWPIIAEGVALPWLGHELDGRPMCGVLDTTATTSEQTVAGYREATAPGTSVLAPAGARITGYKQHRAVVTPRAGVNPAWTWSGGNPEGFVWRQVHASQLGLHWAAAPEIARRVVAAAHAGPQGAANSANTKPSGQSPNTPQTSPHNHPGMPPASGPVQSGHGPGSGMPSSGQSAPGQPRSPQGAPTGPSSAQQAQNFPPHTPANSGSGRNSPGLVITGEIISGEIVSGPRGSGPGFSGPPFPGPPFPAYGFPGARSSSSFSGPPTSGPPTSGPPTSGPATSGPPTSGPVFSGRPTSAPAYSGPPTSVPASGPAFTGPPASSPGFPVTGVPGSGLPSRSGPVSSFPGTSGAGPAFPAPDDPDAMLPGPGESGPDFSSLDYPGPGPDYSGSGGSGPGFPGRGGPIPDFRGASSPNPTSRGASGPPPAPRGPNGPNPASRGPHGPHPDSRGSSGPGSEPRGPNGPGPESRGSNGPHGPGPESRGPHGGSRGPGGLGAGYPGSSDSGFSGPTGPGISGNGDPDSGFPGHGDSDSGFSSSGGPGFPGYGGPDSGFPGPAGRGSNGAGLSFGYRDADGPAGSGAAPFDPSLGRPPGRPGGDESDRFAPDDSGRFGQGEAGRSGQGEAGRLGSGESGRFGPGDAGRPVSGESGRFGPGDAARFEPGDRDQFGPGDRARFGPGSGPVPGSPEADEALHSMPTQVMPFHRGPSASPGSGMPSGRPFPDNQAPSGYPPGPGNFTGPGMPSGPGGPGFLPGPGTPDNQRQGVPSSPGVTAQE